MSATNTTTHYNLPSFVGSDKPAWLVDWNGAMASIDSAIYEAKSTADQAVTAAAAVASDLATLSGTVSTQGSSITTLSETLTTAVGNINTINGNINTINSLIGNGTPTTTDQTIIGAINEINANLTDEIIIGDNIPILLTGAGTTYLEKNVDISKTGYKAIGIASCNWSSIGYNMNSASIFPNTDDTNTYFAFYCMIGTWAATTTVTCNIRVLYKKVHS